MVVNIGLMCVLIETCLSAEPPLPSVPSRDGQKAPVPLTPESPESPHKKSSSTVPLVPIPAAVAQVEIHTQAQDSSSEFSYSETGALRRAQLKLRGESLELQETRDGKQITLTRRRLEQGKPHTETWKADDIEQFGKQHPEALPHYQKLQQRIRQIRAMNGLPHPGAGQIISAIRLDGSAPGQGTRTIRARLDQQRVIIEDHYGRNIKITLLPLTDNQDDTSKPQIYEAADLEVLKKQSLSLAELYQRLTGSENP